MSDLTRTRYVVGFAYSEDRQHVLLILKNRPAWQNGMLNGVGGHIEANESPVGAMRREFLEETGLTSGEIHWQKFAILSGDTFEVHFWRAYTNLIWHAETTTDEPVDVYQVNALPDHVTPNLRWLVPMGAHEQIGRGMPFQILEIGSHLGHGA